MTLKLEMHAERGWVLRPARAPFTTKPFPRRTPLDDALTGKYWCCAKLLFGFGAEHTIDITPEARAEVDAIPVDDIRECVMAEKVQQGRRRGVVVVLPSNCNTARFYLGWFLSIDRCCKRAGRTRRSIYGITSSG